MQPRPMTPPRETRESIAEWASQFGPATPLRVLIRAQEECVELLRALEMGDTAKAAEECADVLIVLARLDIDLGFLDQPSAEDPAIVYASHMNRHLANAVDNCVLSFGVSTWLIIKNAGHAAAALKIDIHDEIDKKMARNRAREWALDGSGCAYHTSEPEDK